MNSFNYSAINTYRKCPTYWQFTYLHKTDDGANLSGDMAYGRALHLGLYQLILGEDGLAIFLAYWDRYLGNEEMNYTRFGWAELREIGFETLKRFKRLYVKKFEVVQMETRLHGKLGDLSIEGTPDFVGRYMGIPVILDFKTARMHYSQMTVRISEQLYLYAELAKQNLKFQAEELIYLVFVKNLDPAIQTVKEAFRESTSAGLLLEFKMAATSMLSNQETGVYPKNLTNCISKSNQLCPFFYTCHKEVSDVQNTEEYHTGAHGQRLPYLGRKKKYDF